MGRIIRRTVTITITETWTVVWTEDVRSEDVEMDGKPQPQTTTILPDQPKPPEEETILSAVTPDAATDAQPTDLSPKSGAGSQRKRTRGRRAAE